MSSEEKGGQLCHITIKQVLQISPCAREKCPAMCVTILPGEMSLRTADQFVLTQWKVSFRVNVHLSKISDLLTNDCHSITW